MSARKFPAHTVTVAPAAVGFRVTVGRRLSVRPFYDETFPSRRKALRAGAAQVRMDVEHL